MRLVILTSLLLVVAAVSTCVATETGEVSYYEKILREKNIAPTTEGMREYFQQLHPSAEQKQRTELLLKQLGSKTSYAAREDAMAKLLVMPKLPSEALIAASEGSDPEIRWRALKILQLGKPEADRVFYAALRTVQHRKLGIADELLRAVPLCDSAHLKYAVRMAIQVAARPSDSQLIKQSLTSANLQTRLAAIGAIGRIHESDAASILAPLLKDENEQVQLATATALANVGDRQSLSSLLSLCSSSDANIRSSSSLSLRQLTGQSFGFVPYGKPEERTTALEKWTAWIDEEGKTAKLKFPLNPLIGSESYLNGNTLIATGYRNAVIEIDASGTDIWKYENSQGCWSAEKLQNGNVLIAEYSAGRVVEVDRDKNIVWQYKCSSPLNAKALLNGNILIAEYGSRWVKEVDRDKNVVWKHQCLTSVCDVHRLRNGNTLCAELNRIVELTPDGKEIWTYGQVQGQQGQFYGCQPLPNGNILIANLSGKVVELTRDKQVVWEYATNSACDVFRLPNGNTLVTNSANAIEVTPDKKVVWTRSNFSYGTARR